MGKGGAGTYRRDQEERKEPQCNTLKRSLKSSIKVYSKRMAQAKGKEGGSKVGGVIIWANRKGTSCLFP